LTTRIVLSAGTVSDSTSGFDRQDRLSIPPPENVT
jgi:hypothetical protein